MGPTGDQLYGIAHVKVYFILIQKMYIISGRIVWTTCFVDKMKVAKVKLPGELKSSI